LALDFPHKKRYKKKMKTILKQDIAAIPPSRYRRQLSQALQELGIKITDPTFYQKIKSIPPYATFEADNLWHLNVEAVWSDCKDNTGAAINPAKNEKKKTLEELKLLAQVRRTVAQADKEERLEKIATGKLISADTLDQRVLALAVIFQQQFSRALEDHSKDYVELVGGDTERSHALTSALKTLLRRTLSQVYASGDVKISIDPVPRPEATEAGEAKEDERV
jgi:hypothetical protein